VRRQLVVAPTGAGKTLLVARVPELIGDPRMVYVAHREELLQQTLGTSPPRTAGPDRGPRARGEPRRFARHCHTGYLRLVAT
jgi:hypothetical protein